MYMYICIYVYVYIYIKTYNIYQYIYSIIYKILFSQQICQYLTKNYLKVTFFAPVDMIDFFTFPNANSHFPCYKTT